MISSSMHFTQLACWPGRTWYCLSSKITGNLPWPGALGARLARLAYPNPGAPPGSPEVAADRLDGAGARRVVEEHRLVGVLPRRALRARVARVAREEMPVQVPHRVAEELVVHLVRAERPGDGAGHAHHVPAVGRAVRLGEVVQLGGVTARDDQRVAGVVLIGAEDGDGARQERDAARHHA